MAPPSQFSIAISSLQRLVKEKASYHSELKTQQERIDRLEGQRSQAGDKDERAGENDEFILNQEKRALEETKSVFPRLEESIRAAVANLERLLESGEEGDADAAKAREVIDLAKGATD